MAISEQQMMREVHCNVMKEYYDGPTVISKEKLIEGILHQKKLGFQLTEVLEMIKERVGEPEQSPDEEPGKCCITLMEVIKIFMKPASANGSESEPTVSNSQSQTQSIQADQVNKSTTDAAVNKVSANTPIAIPEKEQDVRSEYSIPPGGAAQRLEEIEDDDVAEINKITFEQVQHIPNKKVKQPVKLADFCRGPVKQYYFEFKETNPVPMTFYKLPETQQGCDNHNKKYPAYWPSRKEFNYYQLVFLDRCQQHTGQPAQELPRTVVFEIFSKTFKYWKLKLSRENALNYNQINDLVILMLASQNY